MRQEEDGGGVIVMYRLCKMAKYSSTNQQPHENYISRRILSG